ncbi:MAG: hypothetical protein EOO61_00785, partial [Hymenobacter sp.]
MHTLATHLVDLTSGFTWRRVAACWLVGLAFVLARLSPAQGQAVIEQGPLPAPSSVTVPRAQWGAPTEYTLSFPHQSCGNLAGLRVEVGLDTGPDHAGATSFTTAQQVTVVVSSTGGVVAPITFTSSLAISQTQPEHWRLLNVSSFLGSNSVANDLTFKVSVPNQPSITGVDPGTQRIIVRCMPDYRTYTASTLTVSPLTVTSTAGYEQTLRWTSTCQLVTAYQVQLLFRPVKASRRTPLLSSTDPSYDPTATPSLSEWNQNGSLIETGSSNLFYQLTLAEGEGT